MRDFADAQARAIAAVRAVGGEEVALDDAAGRVLLRTLVAREPLVPFARSAMDGYAVRAVDLHAAPLRLPLRGAIYARSGEATLAPGTTVTIATGAPLPDGADAIVPDEEVVADGDGVAFAAPTVAGRHVFPAGDDARPGEPLLRGGTRLNAPKLGLLAAAGIARLAVFRRPRITVLCTGDELVRVDLAPAHGQIRESNTIVLAHAARACGGEIAAVRRIADDPEALYAALGEACAGSDLVITCGGAGGGPRDYVKAQLRELGAEMLFDAIAMRPGRPTGFAACGGAAVAVLPGNPAAAFVAFAEIVGPVVRALAGRTETRLPRIRARLRGHLHARPARTYFAFVALGRDDAGPVVAPLDDQCSALTRTSAEANALAIVPPGPRAYASGEAIEADVFSWDGFGEKIFPDA